MIGLSKPQNVSCEVKLCSKVPATHIYGPECEAETGKLMYVCKDHADALSQWASRNRDLPVECPTHGIIGQVRNSLILREWK